MQDYHYIWLKAHPERTEQWLQQRLDDGFQIHHIDGDHFNDAVDNLLLIEKRDHFRLHQQATCLRVAIVEGTIDRKDYSGQLTTAKLAADARRQKRLERKKRQTINSIPDEIGEKAYHMFIRSEDSWTTIGKRFGLRPTKVMNAALAYAEANKLPTDRWCVS